MNDTEIAVVHNKIRKYRLPLFESLATQFDTDFYIFDENPREYPFQVKFVDQGTLFREIRQGSYDVVILPDYVFKESWTAGVAAAISRAGVVTWTEVWDMPHTPPLKMILKQLLAFGMGLLGDTFVVPGTKAENFLISNTIADEKNIFKAPNAHTIPEATSGIAEKYEIDDGTKTVLYLGQLIERKRVHDIIHSFKALETDYEVVLLVCGTGDDKYTKYLKGIADEETVKFLGRIPSDEIRGLYELSDVYVLPSLQDPYPLTVVEAMSTGTPVVVSEGVGEAGDIVHHGKTGEIVPTKSPDRIAVALKKILGDKNYHSNLSKEGKKIVDEQVTYEKMITEIHLAVKRAIE